MSPEPAAVPAPDANAQPAEWFVSLPDDQKASYDGVKTKALPEVLTEYRTARQAAEDKAKERDETLKGALVPPGKDATAEQQAAYQATLRELTGVPKTPADYKLELPEALPADDPTLQKFVAVAHAEGMTPAQVSKAVAFYAQFQQEAVETQRVDAAKQLDDLWGPKLKENVETAKRGFLAVATEAGIKPEESERLLNTPGLGDNPSFIRIMHQIARHYKQDSSPQGGGSGGGGDQNMAKRLYPNMA